jgi:hypothetical protein
MTHIVTAIPPLPQAALLALRTPIRGGQAAALPSLLATRLPAPREAARALPAPGLRDMLQQDSFIFR